MANKLNRVYSLKVRGGDGTLITITNPITVEFSITRQNLASLNQATFTIYNLNERTRLQIYKDPFDPSNVRPIEFYAGYNYDNKPFIARCFAGEIREAYSFRDGVNYKTVLSCWDGGKAAAVGFGSSTFAAGTPFSSMIRSMVQTMPNILGSIISPQFDNQVNARPTTFFGNQLEQLNQVTGNNFYIDNQQGYALKNDDAIEGEINLIDEQLGLINTPRRNQTLVTLSMIFEPRLIPSQVVKLQSSAEPIYNGIYKLTGIEHNGIISETVAGELTTNVTLLNTNIKNLVKSAIFNYLGA